MERERLGSAFMGSGRLEARHAAVRRAKGIPDGDRALRVLLRLLCAPCAHGPECRELPLEGAVGPKRVLRRRNRQDGEEGDARQRKEPA
jgi:hypothetical protein